MSGSARVFAWGCEGHQTAALVANGQLHPGVRDLALKILQDSPIDPSLRRYCDGTGLGAFADAATWADDYRVLHQETAPWHYIDIPIGVKGAPDLDALCSAGCVTKAIQDQAAILKSGSNPGERANALRFLIHFVGDIHQPLHSSDNGDHGANCFPVSYFEVKAHLTGPHDSAHPNLHSVWDTDLVRTLMARQNWTVEAFANHLNEAFGGRFAEWKRQPIDPRQWALEAAQRSRLTVYGNLPVEVPREPGAEPTDCSGPGNISQRIMALDESIGETYFDAAGAVIQVQLAKAGTRLAQVLNEALKTDATKPSASE